MGGRALLQRAAPNADPSATGGFVVAYPHTFIPVVQDECRMRPGNFVLAIEFPEILRCTTSTTGGTTWGKQLGVSDISTRRRAVRWRGAKCSGTLTPRVGCAAVYIWVPAVFRCAGVLPDILSYTPTCLVMIHAKRHLGLCDGKPFPPVLPFEVDCAERIGGAQP